jgi:hypothetical protein
MNFRKVPTKSFQGNFCSLADPFFINGSGLHWSYQVLITTKSPERLKPISSGVPIMAEITELTELRPQAFTDIH